VMVYSPTSSHRIRNLLTIIIDLFQLAKNILPLNQGILSAFFKLAPSSLNHTPAYKKHTPNHSLNSTPVILDYFYDFRIVLRLRKILPTHFNHTPNTLKLTLAFHKHTPNKEKHTPVFINPIPHLIKRVLFMAGSGKMHQLILGMDILLSILS